MAKKNNLDKIKELRERIERYNNYYYNENKSLISDLEYDNLLKELEELEKKEVKTGNLSLFQDSSPTQTPGAKVSGNKFQKVTHKKRMLSLANTYNLKDLEDFNKRLERILLKDGIKEGLTYALELKLDGLSISLHYEEGVLVQGVTRGDGSIGEDVTENILEIGSIPKKLTKPLSIEVRGEIILPISEFKKLNGKRLENNEDIFANPRNAASGTLRQKDSKIVKERNLDCYAYYLVDSDKLGFTSHIETTKYLEELGFKTTKVFEECKDMKELHNRVMFWEKEKERLDYETDGMVIKVDNLKLYEKLGATNKAPRWAISYKFPAKQVTTRVNNISWQVGRTGKVTPVAELDEVEVSGSMVRRASLHNYDEILRKDLRIGDRVFIEKAAEIIPQVVKVIKETRDGSEKKIELPTKCPVCDSKLDNIEKKLSYKNLIWYLGIEKVGEKKAEILAQETKNLETLEKMSLEDLVKIPTIGKKMGEEIRKFFLEKENIEFISKLKKLGVPLSLEEGEKSVVKVEFMKEKKLLDFISKDDTVDIKCINEMCPSRLQTKIEYFVSRDAMNIDGLGGKIIEKFLELGKIKEIGDIYRLKDYKEELKEIEKMGEKSIENLLISIENSKERKYSQVLYSLGIPHMGKFIAKTIASYSKNLDNLMTLEKEELMKIDGIGEKVGDSIYNFFRDEKNLELIDDLRKVGVNFSEKEKDQEREKEEFKGKTFLATGKLQHFKRSEIKEKIEELGGTNIGSVTKKLDYLIVGEKAGSKLKKAQELGSVKILTEEEFLNLLEG